MIELSINIAVNACFMFLTLMSFFYIATNVFFIPLATVGIYFKFKNEHTNLIKHNFSMILMLLYSILFYVFLKLFFDHYLANDAVYSQINITTKNLMVYLTSFFSISFFLNFGCIMYILKKEKVSFMTSLSGGYAFSKTMIKNVIGLSVCLILTYNIMQIL